MKKYLEILKSVPLFHGIDENDLEKMCNCLNVNIKKYKKNSTIIMLEDKISSVGIVLSGNVQVAKEDYLGNKNILTELQQGEIFAETFACAGINKSPVSVLSIGQCEVAFINYAKIINICPSACTFHARLIANMLKLIANKNLILNQKIEFISKRSTREKLMSYFAVQMEKSKSHHFEIPFSRHELADFLCVDRSAMSREIGKMRDEEILHFKGNKFEML